MKHTRLRTGCGDKEITEIRAQGYATRLGQLEQGLARKSAETFRKASQAANMITVRFHFSLKVRPRDFLGSLLVGEKLSYFHRNRPAHFNPHVAGVPDPIFRWLAEQTPDERGLRHVGLRGTALRETIPVSQPFSLRCNPKFNRCPINARHYPVSSHE